jgi:hypothetical protein
MNGEVRRALVLILQAALKTACLEKRMLKEARQIPGLQLKKLDITFRARTVIFLSFFCGLMYDIAGNHTIGIEWYRDRRIGKTWPWPNRHTILPFFCRD